MRAHLGMSSTYHIKSTNHMSSTRYETHRNYKCLFMYIK